jgi:protease IV
MAFKKSMKSIITFAAIIILISLSPTITDQIKKFYNKYIDYRSAVGVISIQGVLYDSSEYNKYLRKYFQDDDIKAILLKIECPGSAAGTGQAIFNEILTLKKKHPKPILTLVENICASGGYYIASATDHIITTNAALIGSIGSYFPYLFQLEDFIEQYKIHYASIKAGKYKAATDPFVTITDDEKAMLQSLLDDTYTQFTHDVARQRTISLQDIEKWAEGKIFTGHQARALGLVDEIGSASQAVQFILSKTLIESEDHIRWVRPTTKNTVYTWLSGDSGDNGGLFNRVMASICSFLEQRYGSTNALHIRT